MLGAGGTANHLHLLISLSKRIALCQLVMTIKKDTSRWIKTKSSQFADFHWQDGYGAFTIGESQVENVLSYLVRQKEKHRTMSFEEELIAFAQRYGISYESKYLWT